MSWPWQIQRKVKIEHARVFSEGELDAALAVTHDNPVWRAVHQLIDVAESNANENAAANTNNPGDCAGYVGGAAHLRMLREELYTRRTLGIQELGLRAPMEAMK